MTDDEFCFEEDVFRSVRLPTTICEAAPDAPLSLPPPPLPLYYPLCPRFHVYVDARADVGTRAVAALRNADYECICNADQMTCCAYASLFCEAGFVALRLNVFEAPKKQYVLELTRLAGSRALTATAWDSIQIALGLAVPARCVPPMLTVPSVCATAAETAEPEQLPAHFAAWIQTGSCRTQLEMIQVLLRTSASNAPALREHCQLFLAALAQASVVNDEVGLMALLCIQAILRNGYTAHTGCIQRAFVLQPAGSCESAFEVSLTKPELQRWCSRIKARMPELFVRPAPVPPSLWRAQLDLSAFVQELSSTLNGLDRLDACDVLFEIRAAPGRVWVACFAVLEELFARFDVDVFADADDTQCSFMTVHGYGDPCVTRALGVALLERRGYIEKLPKSRSSAQASETIACMFAARAQRNLGAPIPHMGVACDVDPVSPAAMLRRYCMDV